MTAQTILVNRKFVQLNIFGYNSKNCSVTTISSNFYFIFKCSSFNIKLFEKDTSSNSKYMVLRKCVDKNIVTLKISWNCEFLAKSRKIYQLYTNNLIYISSQDVPLSILIYIKILHPVLQ